MKKKVMTIAAISIGMIIGLSSCGKKEEPAPAPEPAVETQSEAEKKTDDALSTEDVKLKTEEISGWKFSVPESWTALDKMEQFAVYQIDDNNSLNVTVFDTSLSAAGLSLEDFANLNAGEEASAPVKEDGMPYETYSMSGKMTGGTYTSNYFINGDDKGILWLSVFSNEENPSCLGELKNIAASVDASGVVASVTPDITEAEIPEDAPAAEEVKLDDASEENKEIMETTQLYKDFFKPYADGVGSILLNGFQAAEDRFDNYEVEVTEGNEEDLWEYRIYDDNGDYVLLSFYPENVEEQNADDWIWSLCLLTYERPDEKEISINDGYHLYSPPKMSTWQADREPKSQDVSSIAELEEFMFGE